MIRTPVIDLNSLLHVPQGGAQGVDIAHHPQEDTHAEGQSDDQSGHESVKHIGRGQASHVKSQQDQQRHTQHDARAYAPEEAGAEPEYGGAGFAHGPRSRLDPRQQHQQRDLPRQHGEDKEHQRRLDGRSGVRLARTEYIGETKRQHCQQKDSQPYRTRQPLLGRGDLSGRDLRRQPVYFSVRTLQTSVQLVPFGFQFVEFHIREV